MYELHQHEQYFFDRPTLEHLTRFLAPYPRVAVLCAPMLGRALAGAGREVRVLDIDDRFADVPGYRHWNIHRPEYLAEDFDVIVCDPPFFNVSLSRLFRAIRVLAQQRFDQPLMISYLQRRGEAVMGAFSPFGLQATGYSPGYVTVRPTEKNAVAFFANLGEEAHRALCGQEPLAG